MRSKKEGGEGLFDVLFSGGWAVEINGRRSSRSIPAGRMWNLYVDLWVRRRQSRRCGKMRQENKSKTATAVRVSSGSVAQEDCQRRQ